MSLTDFIFCLKKELFGSEKRRLKVIYHELIVRRKKFKYQKRDEFFF